MGRTNVSQYANYYAETEQQGDGSQRQVVKVAESVAAAAPSGIVAGAKVVAAAGTAETLVAASTACKKVTMTANDDNTGKVFYGGSTVSSSVGDYLFPAQKHTFEIDDLQKVYIDVENNGEGVKFTYFT